MGVAVLLLVELDGLVVEFPETLGPDVVNHELCNLCLDRKYESSRVDRKKESLRDTNHPDPSCLRREWGGDVIASLKRFFSKRHPEV